MAQQQLRRERGRDLWKAILLADAIALSLAMLLVIWAERAQMAGDAHSSRLRFGWAQRGLQIAGGWASATFLHSERMQRLKQTLPPTWPLLLATTRVALLSVLLLPAVAIWRSAIPELQVFSPESDVFLMSGTLAISALLLSRLRARGLGTFSLLLCSGVATMTLILLLLCDGIWRAGPAGVSNALSQWNLPFMPRSLLGAALDGRAVALAAPDTGYLIGISLVCVTALVMGAALSRQSLFEQPALEYRAISPLAEPLPREARARLHIMRFSVLISVLLALRPLGASVSTACCMALGVSIFLWGWHCRELGPRQVLGALVWAAGASLALCGVAALSGDAAMRSFWSELIKQPSPTLLGLWSALLVEVKNAVSMPYSLLAMGWLLVSTMFLLRRQPPHLWSVLGHAPGWGWMLLGGLVTTLALSLVTPFGHVAALGLLMTILPAFFFVWLEGL